jgi:hypothetical protein
VDITMPTVISLGVMMYASDSAACFGAGRPTRPGDYVGRRNSHVPSAPFAS